MAKGNRNSINTASSLGFGMTLRSTAGKLGGDPRMSSAPRHNIHYLHAHPGFCVPTRSNIVEHYGDSLTELPSQQIMSLTNVNWNGCSFAGRDPLINLFVRTMARPLTGMPSGIQPQTKYKIYM